MRLFAAIVLAWCVLVTPASAQGDPQACLLGGGPYAYQQRLTLLLDEAEAAAREAVGAQFTMLWLSDRDQGWDIGLAPGTLTVEQARDAIVGELGRRVTGDDLATLTSLLKVVPQPYSRAELDRVQGEIEAQLEGLGPAWSLGIGCDEGDAFRVHVELYNDATPDAIGRARTIVEPYGDIARLTVLEEGPPTPAQAPTAPLRLRDLVAFPKACVSGARARIVVRFAARAATRRMTVTVAGKRRTREIGRLGKPVVVRLAGERTRVRIGVRLRDGQYIKRAVNVLRCR